MKKVYLLFGSILVLSIADLFFTSIATEKIHLYLGIALLLVFLVCLVMVPFSKARPWKWRLTIVLAAMVTIVLYFKTNNLRNKAAFHIAFYQHQEGYLKFAKLMSQKSDSLVRDLKAKDSSRYVFIMDVMTPLYEDVQLKNMGHDLGIRFQSVIDSKQGDKVIEGKFLPIMPLVGGGTEYGLIYNPTDVEPDKPAVGFRGLSRHDANWQFYSEHMGGGGIAAPM